MATVAHRALYCQEIAANVFEHLAPMTLVEMFQEHPGFQPRVEATRLRLRLTLLHCALTCKALSEPALDVLWMRLDDLLPLLMLVPKARNEQYRDCDSNVEVDEDEWERFQRYARRVRVLHHCTSSRWSNYEIDLFTRLSRRAGGAPLFPRLRYLRRLTVLPCRVGPLIETALLSPGLRRLSITFTAEATRGGCQIAIEGVKALHSISPCLEHLSLEIEDAITHAITRYEVVQILPTLVGAFRGLRHLAIDKECILETTALIQLSRMESLEYLSASLGLPFDAENRPTADLHFGTFPTLKHVSLSGCGDHFALFFSASSMPLLESLALQLVRDREPLDFLKCVTTVLRNVPHTLTSLELTSARQQSLYWFETTNPPDPPDALLRLLEPALKNMRALQRVVVDLVYLPPVDDASIERMLAAWPALAELRIDVGRRSDASTSDGPLRRPTLNALVTIGTRYPGLRWLELPQTDVAMAGRLCEKLSSPGGHHKLRRLLLDPWQAADCDLEGRRIKRKGDNGQWKYDVALLLDRLFPFLELPPSFRRDETKWTPVLEYLMCMQAGRWQAGLLEEVEPRTMAEVGLTEDFVDVRVYGWCPSTLPC
ncbi:hypothetical protein BV20DRAFT_971418 [Pilatotrama ljubarskyi]|nr:hypothetical protein BV20DRAFT_971418 [Pilatotrama ljubarskyi]